MLRRPGTWTSYFRLKSEGLVVRVESAERLIEQMYRQMRLFALLLGSVGSISLLVGGIGVMNVMLVSVTERRREIGIRRALGARRADIQGQFLIESVMLSLAGGVVGIGAGMGATWGDMRVHRLGVPGLDGSHGSRRGRGQRRRRVLRLLSGLAGGQARSRGGAAGMTPRIPADAGARVGEEPPSRSEPRAAGKRAVGTERRLFSLRLIYDPGQPAREGHKLSLGGRLEIGIGRAAGGLEDLIAAHTRGEEAMKMLTAIAATAACAAALLALTPSPASALFDDAFAKSRCENALKHARSNTKITDVNHFSWKLERVVYEKEGSHELEPDLEYDRSKWVNYNQIHCIISAKCPETTWPTASPASKAWLPGTTTAAYYDDPRRKWFYTQAYGSIAEVERMSCKGGKLK